MSDFLLVKHREAKDNFAEDFSAALNGDTLATVYVTIRSPSGVDVTDAMVVSQSIASGTFTYLLGDAQANTDQVPGRYAVFLQGVTNTGRKLVREGVLTVTGGPTLHNGAVDHVTVTPGSVSVPVGSAPQQLTATAYNAAGVALAGRNQVWSSSDTTVAVVDRTGTVALLAVGTATLTVVIGGVSQTVPVTVTTATTQLAAQETVVALVVGHARNGAYTPEDANGTATTDPVTYTSSDTTVATVAADGTITPVAPGSVTITATCGTLTHARTFTCYADLVPTLAWEPLKGQTYPRVFTPAGTDGYVHSEPTYAGSGNWPNNVRRSFLRAPGSWGVMGPAGAGPSNPNGAMFAWGTTVTDIAEAMPFDGGAGTHPIQLTFSQGQAMIQWGMSEVDHVSSADPLEPGFRQGQVYWVRAHSAADVGKTMTFGWATANGGPPPIWDGATKVTLSLAWQRVEISARSAASLTPAYAYAVTVSPNNDANGALTCDLWWTGCGTGTAHDMDRPFGGFPCTRWGLPLEQVYANAWGPDSDHPTVYGGTDLGDSDRLTPDSDSWIGGHRFRDYQLNDGGGLTTAAPCDISQALDAANQPGTEVWAHVYLAPGPVDQAMPADGDLQFYLDIPSGPTYGPFDLTRDPVQLREADGACFYRAKLTGLNASSEGYLRGTPRIQNTTGRTLWLRVTRCACITTNYRSLGWHQTLVPRRNLRVMAPASAPTLVAATTGGTLATGTYYYKVTALDSAGESIASAEASVAVTGPTGKVTVSWPAVSGATGYRIYRGTAAGAENVYYAPSGTATSYVDTNGASTAGTPNATMPRQVAELCWMVVNDVTTILGVDEGFVVYRGVLPWALGDGYTMGMPTGPGFWQTGPYGSADYNFDMSLDTSGSTSLYPKLSITMNRDAAVAPGYDSWGVTVPLPNDGTKGPAFQAFDVIVAWKGRQPVAFGLGLGAGSDITWYQDGDPSPFGNGAIAIAAAAGTTWEWTAGGSMVMGFADRDRTRTHGGWLQGYACGKTVPATVAEAQAVLAEHVRYHLGDRPSY